MGRDRARELCLRLQEETLQRIREDRKRVSVRVAELLAMIEERLVHPDLQVKSLRRWCHTGDKNVSTRFAQELGLGPWAYITEARMELAGRMLVGSKLKVWPIAVQVGYLSANTFGRAFKQWSGTNPGAFRKTAWAGGEPPEGPAELVSRAELDRALDGDLPPAEAAALVARLGDLQDRICANYQTPDPALVSVWALEKVMARNLWRLIESLPYEVQEKAVSSQAPAFKTPALFYRLCTVSLEVGADDDVRGMQIASLALACVPPLAKHLGDHFINICARAYAVAGNAQRRSGEGDEAVMNFVYAERMLTFAGDNVDPVVLAELCFYRATYEIEKDNFKIGAQLVREGQKIIRAVFDKLKRQQKTTQPGSPT